MLNQSVLATLLASLVVGGCIGVASVEPHPVAGEGSGPLHWLKVIDDTVYLVRIDANEPMTIEKSLPGWPEDDFQLVTAVVGDFPSIHAKKGTRALIAVQEHHVPFPFDDDPPSNPEGSLTRGPGSYYVVLDSTGAAGTFTVTSADATLTVLAVDPAMGTYRTNVDGEWDYHLRVSVFGGRQIMLASTEIPLHHSYTLTLMYMGGDPWEVELDPVCSFQSSDEWWWVVSDAPIDLEVKTYPGVHGSSLSAYVLDLPLPIPEVGCWQYHDWQGIPGPT